MSAWKPWNPNPTDRRVGDCAVRAVAKAFDISWDEAYCRLCAEGYAIKDMPNANAIWGALLHENGFQKEAAPDDLPGYTLEQFCADHPRGLYVVATSGHVVTVDDGKCWDSWDSTQEIPIYYYRG